MPGVRAGFRLSEDVKRTTPPCVPAAWDWIARYKGHEARPLIDLSQGSPGASPPDFLLSALSAAARTAASAKYGPILGDPALKAGLVGEMRHVYELEDGDVLPEDVAITSGCNLAFAAVSMAICDKGDEVIVPFPWYFNQQQTLEMRGIKQVPLRTSAENGFIPQPAECEKLITSRTKAITLISPNNPTGAIYPPDILAEFGLLARKHGIALIIDETYRDFVGHKPHDLFSRSLLGRKEEWEWRKHIVHLFSFSKSYAVPGHRLGALAAGPEVLEYVEKVLDCFQICPPRAIQLALAPNFPAMRPFIHSNLLTLSARHAALRSALPPRWTVAAQGGFFAFVRHPFPGHSSLEVCERLALELGLVGLPGSFFAPEKGDGFWGGEGRALEEDRWIRLGIANVLVEEVELVGERLREAEETFGWELQ